MLKFCYYLGGEDGKNYLKTTEIIHANGSKTDGPIELPETRAHHCMVEYAGIVILMGGEYVTHNDQLLCFSDLTEFFLKARLPM